MLLQCGRFRLDLGRPQLMAIINLTEDSFSGDGVGDDISLALRRAEAALEAGADILDLGAESTRPGSLPATAEVEIARLVPVVKALQSFNVPLSIDTTKAVVMQAVLEAGADLINDINALRDPGAIEAVADSNAAVCLMHMLGQPQTMQQAPQYGDVCAEVEDFLLERVAACREGGIAPERILLDPGYGFGKTVEHNLALLKHQARLLAHGYPVLAGLSRKSMLGAITGRPVDQRMVASVVGALIAVQNGARIIRVHDVAATRDMLKVWEVLEATS